MLYINVAVSFYFLKSQKQFFLYSLSFSLIANEPSNFQNKFQILWLFIPRYHRSILVSNINYFGLSILIYQSPSGCVIISSFVCPPFIYFSSHNSYFGNIWVFSKSNNYNNTGCCCASINHSNLHVCLNRVEAYMKSLQSVTFFIRKNCFCM